MSNHLKNTIFVILIAAVMLVVGEYIGETAGLYLFSQPSATTTVSQDGAAVTTTAKKASYDEGYKAGLDYARKRLETLKILPTSVTSLSNATVKSVSGQNIVVEVEASYIDIFKEGKTTKTVKVPATVAIEERTPKSAEDIKKDYAEYEKKIKALDVRSKAGEDVTEEKMKLRPPDFFAVKKLKLSDLKKGDVISVTSDSDIRKSDTFDAKTVVLLSRAATQTTTTSTGTTTAE